MVGCLLTDGQNPLGDWTGSEEDELHVLLVSRKLIIPLFEKKQNKNEQENIQGIRP